MCHDAGVPLVVDEAHGAPLAFLRGRDGAPAPAIAAGADVAVQSSHKTLSALGQARGVTKRHVMIVICTCSLQNVSCACAL